ncbi:MAG: DUF2304 family protein, partial [bacterium]|nr:DUF2304 family protein [bacterium]
MNDFPLIQRLVGIGAGVVMLGAVLWLIAKRRLAISYSLLWVAISLVSIGFCASYGVAAELFRSLGITPLS